MDYLNLKQKSKPGLNGYSLSGEETEKQELLSEDLLRQDLNLPDISEPEVMRHFQALSRMNYGVDDGFYPLGSCTMKYNPRINETLSGNAGFNIHPLCGDDFSQGCLQVIYELKQSLSIITGLPGVSLHANAGAHGELLGLMLIKAYHQKAQQNKKNILIPSSAHGTNPASVTICGFEAEEVAVLNDGTVDVEDLKSKLGADTAGIMLTNPNTAGIFETQIKKITDLVHESGGLVYMDGANMNALMGKVLPADMGIDVMHLNLHKSFSTPHGGGGPGSGAVLCVEKLAPFLPVPDVQIKQGKYHLDYSGEFSVGKINAFYGNFGVLVRALSYIKALGAEGIKGVAENSVLNANYLFSLLKDKYDSPFDKICMHEFILTDKDLPNGVTTMHIAKRLLDYGYHPPTVYFPLIVKAAIMIEPTETETIERINGFKDAMLKILKEAHETPDIVKSAPLNTPVKKVDEVNAARKPVLNWKMEE